MGDLSQFGPQVRTILALVVVCVGAALVIAGSGLVAGRSRLRPANGVLAVGAAAAIVAATVSPRSLPTPGLPTNLVPFHTMRGYWWMARHGAGLDDLLVYVAGNVVLFAPLGFFAYFALRRGVLAAVLVAALLSLACELCQLRIWTRTCDVDDLILNTLGAAVGAAVAWAADSSWHRFAGRHVGPRADGRSAFLQGR